MKSCTVIVVSHIDLRAHQDANELVNIKDFKSWKQSHHECKFEIKGKESLCTQMRNAVREHAKKYWNAYGLHQEGTLEVYPLTSSSHFDHVLRPSHKKNWKPRRHDLNFIFVHPSVEPPLNQSLEKTPSCKLFVKYSDNFHNTLRFCGTVPFFEDELISTKIPHIRNLCNMNEYCMIQIQDIVAKNQYYMIEASKTFKQQRLRMGSILIVSKNCIDESYDRIHKGLSFPPYGQHSYGGCTFFDYPNPTLGAALYDQAKAGKYTDVTLLSSKREAEEQLRLTVHKNVLTTIPYFRAFFEIGMTESNSEQPVFEVEAPSWTTHYALKDFHEYIYLRDPLIITTRSSFSIDHLCDLIRLADFYSFEDLLEKVAGQIPNKYSHLNAENTLELLTLIHSLEFPKRNELESLLLRFVECHFALIGRCQRFGEMQGTDVYNLIIDTMAKQDRPREPSEYDL